MKNPFGDQQIPGPYHNLKERMYKKVSAEVNKRIVDMIKNSYENALNEENIVLTRSERSRLLSQIVKMVTDDILKRFDKPSAGMEK